MQISGLQVPRIQTSEENMILARQSWSPFLLGRGDVRRKKRAADNSVGKHYLKVLAASQALKRLMSH